MSRRARRRARRSDRRSAAVERLAAASRGSSAGGAARASSASSPGLGSSAVELARRRGAGSPRRARACQRSRLGVGARRLGASRQPRQAARGRRAVGSRPPKASSSVAMGARHRAGRCCSNWPSISTSMSPSWRSRPTLDRLVVDEGAAAAVGADLRGAGSAAVAVEALLGAGARAPDGRGDRSNSAVTLACAAPGRTRPLSARPPSARPSASSRIDLPAPVSPVSTRQARREGEVEPVDQHDVADRQAEQHRRSAAARSEDRR